MRCSPPRNPGAPSSQHPIFSEPHPSALYALGLSPIPSAPHPPDRAHPSNSPYPQTELQPSAHHPSALLPPSDPAGKGLRDAQRSGRDGARLLPGAAVNHAGRQRTRHARPRGARSSPVPVSDRLPSAPTSVGRGHRSSLGAAGSPEAPPASDVTL